MKNLKSVVSVVELEVPSHVSMRMGTLKEFGGDFDDLYDSRRFDGGHRSYKDSSKKDHKTDYRSWTSLRALKYAEVSSVTDEVDEIEESVHI